MLAEARATADLFGVNVVPFAVRARAAGEAIVEEAMSGRIEIVVIGAPRKNTTRSGPIFGSTVVFVLQHAPCRVMVAAAPPGA